MAQRYLSMVFLLLTSPLFAQENAATQRLTEQSKQFDEQVVERENDEVLESLGNSSEEELAMIKFALMRIEEGNYFNCCECGEQIPGARLDLLPFTAHCVDCAEKIEN